MSFKSTVYSAPTTDLTEDEWLILAKKMTLAELHDTHYKEMDLHIFMYVLRSDPTFDEEKQVIGRFGKFALDLAKRNPDVYVRAAEAWKKAFELVLDVEKAKLLPKGFQINKYKTPEQLKAEFTDDMLATAAVWRYDPSKDKRHIKFLVRMYDYYKDKPFSYGGGAGSHPWFPLKGDPRGAGVYGWTKLLELHDAHGMNLDFDSFGGDHPFADFKLAVFQKAPNTDSEGESFETLAAGPNLVVVTKSKFANEVFGMGAGWCTVWEVTNYWESYTPDNGALIQIIPGASSVEGAVHTTHKYQLFVPHDGSRFETEMEDQDKKSQVSEEATDRARRILRSIGDEATKAIDKFVFDHTDASGFTDILDEIDEAANGDEEDEEDEEEEEAESRTSRFEFYVDDSRIYWESVTMGDETGEEYDSDAGSLRFIPFEDLDEDRQKVLLAAIAKLEHAVDEETVVVDLSDYDDESIGRFFRDAERECNNSDDTITDNHESKFIIVLRDGLESTVRDAIPQILRNYASLDSSDPDDDHRFTCIIGDDVEYISHYVASVVGNDSLTLDDPTSAQIAALFGIEEDDLESLKKKMKITRSGSSELMDYREYHAMMDGSSFNSSVRFGLSVTGDNGYEFYETLLECVAVYYPASKDSSPDQPELDLSSSGLHAKERVIRQEHVAVHFSRPRGSLYKYVPTGLVRKIVDYIVAVSSGVSYVTIQGESGDFIKEIYDAGFNEGLQSIGEVVGTYVSNYSAVYVYRKSDSSALPERNYDRFLERFSEGIDAIGVLSDQLNRDFADKVDDHPEFQMPYNVPDEYVALVALSVLMGEDFFRDDKPGVVLRDRHRTGSAGSNRGTETTMPSPDQVDVNAVVKALASAPIPNEDALHNYFPEGGVAEVDDIERDFGLNNRDQYTLGNNVKTFGEMAELLKDAMTVFVNTLRTAYDAKRASRSLAFPLIHVYHKMKSNPEGIRRIMLKLLADAETANVDRKYKSDLESED